MGLASAVCLGQPIARFAGDVLLIVYAWVPLAAICCLLLVAVLHQVLRACCRNAYGTRPVAEQVVTCLHAAQALQFAAMAAPMTIYTAQLVWGTFVEVYTDYFIPCFIMFNLLQALYIIEAGARAVVRRNLLLVTHHTVSFLITTIGFYKASIFTLKLGLILAAFTFYEAPLFCTLVARKLGAPRRAVVVLWGLGITTYTVTRVLQAVALGFMYVESYQPLKNCGELAIFWGDAALTLFIIAVQLDTYRIYWGVLRRTLHHTVDESTHALGQAGSKANRLDSCSSSDNSGTVGSELQEDVELGANFFEI